MAMRQRLDAPDSPEGELHWDERHWRSQTIHEGLLFPQIHREFQRYSEAANHSEALKEMQRERLASILRHAIGAVPTYRRTSTTTAGSADPWAQLAEFPLTTKRELSERSIDHCDDGIDPATCRVLETSGTSGIPLRVIRHNDAMVHEWATALVRNQRQGPAFDRKVLMPCLTRPNPWFEYTSPGMGFARVAQFGVIGPRGERPEEFVTRAVNFRPDVLTGTPRNLVDFMDLLQKCGEEPPPVRSIVTCGELLLPAVREAVSDFFGIPVRDMYAMKETGTMAVQCENGLYHVESERLWLEVVDDDGNPLPDGQIGEIVVTDFTNTAMPLIRYRTGDLGSMATESCACGLPHKAMNLVEGRNPGVIRRPDGTTLPAYWIACAARRCPVRRYQIVQRADFTVSLLIEPASTFASAHREELTRNLEDLLGVDMEGRVEIVDDASFLGHGRRKTVDFVSLLPDAPTTVEAAETP
ncbi:AMP-binding protein (plasmid) [Embleya sp. NBC_00888]|uniref:phenylacetate--CoA ligase family protein n=1 Tax=Embleya sp. NBC_00888 TaxID=2975960 RepID=UPI002F912A6D|nr:AMP-binding protein [Embleya sp. NBC_00888]